MRIYSLILVLTQTLCPQVGHLLRRTLTTVLLGNLREKNGKMNVKNAGTAKRSEVVGLRHSDSCDVDEMSRKGWKASY